jgi:hypothetical protein
MWNKIEHRLASVLSGLLHPPAAAVARIASIVVLPAATLRR